MGQGYLDLIFDLFLCRWVGSCLARRSLVRRQHSAQVLELSCVQGEDLLPDGSRAGIPHLFLRVIAQ